MTPNALDVLARAAWLVAAAGQIVADLREDGSPDPLAERLTLAAVLADLFRLAGLPVEREITELLG